MMAVNQGSGKIITRRVDKMLLVQTDKEKLLEARKEYYSNTFVLMEIVKCLKNKELAFLDRDEGKKNIRYLYASKIDLLKKHFEALGFYSHNVNMYCSCSNLSFIPMMTYNLKSRRETDEYKKVHENYQDLVTGYDLFFDFDLKENFEDGYKEVKEFKKILEENKVPYLLHNSSKKGFHFIVQGKYFLGNPIKNIDIFRKILYNIKGIYDFKDLDISICDLKRIRKLQYSVVSDGSVCIPLDDLMFENFNENMVEIKNVLKNIHIMNRGLLERTYGLSFLELQQNVEKFIKEYQ